MSPLSNGIGTDCTRTTDNWALKVEQNAKAIQALTMICFMGKPPRFNRSECRGNPCEVHQDGVKISRSLIDVELIAGITDTDNQSGIFRILLDLLTKRRNVDIDGARGNVYLFSPDSFQEFVARDDFGGSLHQQAKYLKLFVR